MDEGAWRPAAPAAILNPPAGHLPTDAEDETGAAPTSERVTGAPRVRTAQVRTPTHGPALGQSQRARGRARKRSSLVRTLAARWWALVGWLRANTFTPRWLGQGWRHTATGYVAAVLLEIAAVVMAQELIYHYPGFGLAGEIEILAAMLVALSWGAGPSLLATLVGAAALTFSGSLAAPTVDFDGLDDAIEVIIFLLVGCTISVAASQTERARRRAQDSADKLAEQSARLDAVIEAVPDWLAIHDAGGRVQRLNETAQVAAGIPPHDDQGHGESLAPYGLRTLEGEPPPEDEWPVARALKGETSAELELRGRDTTGRERALAVRAAPYRDKLNHIVGAVQLAHDVTALRHAEQEAEARAARLEAANRTVDQFMGIASHELKSPVTVATLNVDVATRRLDKLARAAPHLADELAPVLKVMRKADAGMARLRRLVDELLDVSRIREGKLELKPQACDLARVVRDAVADQRQLYPSRTIRMDVPKGPVKTYADPDRVGQVVTNFLTNAIKYAPAEFPIAVMLQLAGDTVHVSVRDHGPGLPPEEHERVWDLYHQADGVVMLSGDGTGMGIGLHVSRTIVELHGGHVGLVSAAGEGSTFWFTLPLNPEPTTTRP
ncbi:MAG TPA: ATP-binding protein [Ktedonobacterales bacterium]